MKPASSACSLSIDESGIVDLEIVMRCSNAKLIRVLQDRSLMITWARDAPPSKYYPSVQTTERIIQFKPIYLNGIPQQEYFFQCTMSVEVLTLCQYVVDIDVVVFLQNLQDEEQLTLLRASRNAERHAPLPCIDFPLYHRTFSYSDVLPFLMPLIQSLESGQGCSFQSTRSLLPNPMLSHKPSIGASVGASTPHSTLTILSSQNLLSKISSSDRDMSSSSSNTSSNTPSSETIANIIDTELVKLQSAYQQYTLKASQSNYPSLNDALQPLFLGYNSDNRVSGSVGHSRDMTNVQIKRFSTQVSTPALTVISGISQTAVSQDVHTAHSVSSRPKEIPTTSLKCWQLSCDSPSVLIAMHASSRLAILKSKCLDTNATDSITSQHKSSVQQTTTTKMSGSMAGVEPIGGYTYKDQYALPRSLREVRDGWISLS